MQPVKNNGSATGNLCSVLKRLYRLVLSFLLLFFVLFYFVF